MASSMTIWYSMVALAIILVAILAKYVQIIVDTWQQIETIHIYVCMYLGYVI